MVIQQLNDIISSKNLEQISKALEENGYRCATKSERWEFDPILIANAQKVENSQRYEDHFTDTVYVGDIFTQVNEYPNTEFIVIAVNKIHNQQRLEFPIEMLLFTNAPICEDYEREMAKLGKCAICKRQFPMADLCEINGKLICDDCFEADLQRLKSKGKSKLTKKVKK